MVKRVSIKTGESAKPVIPPEGESITGTNEFTILNTHATATVELVDSTGGAFGSGYPLAPGASWSGTCAATTKLYVVTNSAAAVSVAIIGVPVT